MFPVEKSEGNSGSQTGKNAPPRLSIYVPVDLDEMKENLRSDARGGFQEKGT